MNLKKTIVTLSLAFVTTFSYSPRSEAIVGIASWNPMLMGAGLLVLGGGSLVGGAAATYADYAVGNGNVVIRVSGYVSGAVAIVGAAVAYVGGVALPDGTIALQYYPIDENLEQKLNITREEREIYNQELDQVNFITEQVALDLSKIKNPTVEDSKKAWSQYDGMLRPETMKAMVKITSQMFQK